MKKLDVVAKKQLFQDKDGQLMGSMMYSTDDYFVVSPVTYCSIMIENKDRLLTRTTHYYNCCISTVIIIYI